MAPRHYLPPAGDTPTLPLDASPIAIGGFRLKARSVDVIGRPSLQQWQNAFHFAVATEEAGPYWIGDLLEYAAQRHEWGHDTVQQAMGATGLKYQTMLNHHYIAKHVPESSRQVAQTHTHAGRVAKMPAAQQKEWLEESSSRGWTVRELDVNIRASKRRKIIEGQAVLQGVFRVIYADPPWLYRDRPPSKSGAQTHFPGMTIEQLCKLPVAAHTHKDAVLLMWIPPSFMLLNPGPREVMEAWGFSYKTHQVWDKVLSSGGHYFATKHEDLILATRGSCLPDRPTPQPDSVIVERRPADFEHSEKPASFRNQIERMYDGPYLELFAREKVEGWTCFGNDAALWHQEVAV